MAVHSPPDQLAMEGRGEAGERGGKEREGVGRKREREREKLSKKSALASYAPTPIVSATSPNRDSHLGTKPSKP